jgi:uncharacterized protein YdeI (YjbR/CyaY-like superfamily)
MDKIINYIEKKQQWKPELELLRKVVLACDLEETIKWGAPVYMSNGKNILGLSAFKSYVGLWFFQGGTLKDTHKVLMNAQEGKTAAMRQWRFSSLEEIDVNLIKTYVKEAIDNQEKGNIIKPQKNTKPLIIHPLLQKELASNTEFSKQFESFSLSKKREYADHISEAKREATQQKRLEKIIPMILNGVGLYDKYKNC